MTFPYTRQVPRISLCVYFEKRKLVDSLHFIFEPWWNLWKERIANSVFLLPLIKANVEPIRLQQILPTFPYFQLLQFNQLVEDLGLNGSSYLDTYIRTSGQWVQHTISSVRIVDTQERLLYKVRRSLMEGLSEDDCISLREEIQMQSRNARPNPSCTGNSPSPASTQSPNKSSGQATVRTSPDAQSPNPLKRSAPQGDNDETRQSPKIHVTNGYYMAHSGASTMVSSPVSGTSQSNGSTSNVTSPQSSTQDQDNSVYMYQSFYGTSSGSQGSPEASNVLPHYLLSPPTAAPPIPYHPHPPLKRWPNDYTVSELSAGFHAMDLLISQSPTGANMTQRTAFERVFGSRYVKSTVCRHRAVWRKAPRLLREQFEAMGTDERACWGEFVRRVENRPPGKHSTHDLMSPTQGSNMGYHQSQSTPEEEDVHGQESVMNSMQNQGWSYRLCHYELRFTKSNVYLVSSNQNNNGMQNSRDSFSVSSQTTG